MIVIKDTREKAGKGFNLEFYGFDVIRKALKTGDYSIETLENFISIDRKASIEELVQNLFYDYKRFKAELIRGASIANFFILAEFAQSWIDIFPHGTKIPKYKWKYLRATPELIYHKLNIIYKMYGTKIIFCNTPDEAEEMCSILLNKAINNESFDDIEFFRGSDERST